MNPIDVLIDAALPAIENDPQGFTAESLTDEILRTAPEYLSLAGIGREQMVEDVDRALRRRHGLLVEDDMPTREAFAAMTPEQQRKVIADLKAQAARDQMHADALRALCAMKFGPRGVE